MRYPKYNGKPLPKMLRAKFKESYPSLSADLIKHKNVLGYNIKDKELDTIAYNVIAEVVFDFIKSLKHISRKI